MAMRRNVRDAADCRNAANHLTFGAARPEADKAMPEECRLKADFATSFLE